MSTEMVCAAAVSDPGNGAAAVDVIAKSAPRSPRPAQAREMVIDISLPGRHHGGNAVSGNPVPAPQASQLARTLTAQVYSFRSHGIAILPAGAQDLGGHCIKLSRKHFVASRHADSGFAHRDLDSTLALQGRLPSGFREQFPSFRVFMLCSSCRHYA